MTANYKPIIVKEYWNDCKIKATTPQRGDNAVPDNG